MSCRHQSTVMLIIVRCTPEVHNFDVWIFQCTLITFLKLNRQWDSSDKISPEG